MKRETKIWTEKHSPDSFDNYIWVDENSILEKTIKQYIKDGEIKMLLLFGNGGTGKSLLVKLLMNEIPGEFKKFNGSDDTGVDYIRKYVKPFVMSRSSQKGLKYVYIEEAEQLSDSAQKSLKELTLKYIDNVRYILVTNHVDLLNKELRDRFSMGEFKIEPMGKGRIMEYIVKILKKENVEYDVSHVAEVVKRSYPSIRSMINILDKNTFDNKFELDNSILKEMSFKADILEILQSKKINKIDSITQIHQLVANNSVSDYNTIIHYIYENINKITKDTLTQASIFLILNETQKGDRNVYGKGKEINLIAGLNNVIKELKS